MSNKKRLYRSRDKMIGGVCAGLAEYMDVDPTLIRLAYVALSVFTAAFPGILCYILAVIIIPIEP